MRNEEVSFWVRWLLSSKRLRNSSPILVRAAIVLASLIPCSGIYVILVFVAIALKMATQPDWEIQSLLESMAPQLFGSVFGMLVIAAYLSYANFRRLGSRLDSNGMDIAAFAELQPVERRAILRRGDTN